MASRAAGVRFPEMIASRGRPQPSGPDGKGKPRDIRGTARRVLATFKPYKGLLTLLGLTILVTSGLGVVNPLLIKLVFDRALFGLPAGTCDGHACPNLPVLYRLVGLGIAIPIVTSIIGVGQTWLSNSIGLRLMRDL